MKPKTEPKQKQITIPSRLTRVALASECRMEHDEEDDNKMTFSVSSEMPFERYFGTEVLGHEKGEVDLSRLNDGAPLLIDHSNRVDSIIGVVEKAYLEDSRLMADVRFADDPVGQRVKGLVDQGIVRNVSVSYEIIEVRENKKTNEIRAIKWLPREVSFVGVPADASVGIGRADDDATTEKTISLNGGSNNEVTPMPAEKTNAEIIADERKRIGAIQAYGAQFAANGGIELAAAVIAEEGSIDDLQRKINDKLAAESKQKAESNQAEIDAAVNQARATAFVRHVGDDIMRSNFSRVIKNLLPDEQNESGPEMEIIRAASNTDGKRGGFHIPDALWSVFQRQSAEMRMQKKYGIEQRAITTASGSGKGIAGYDHRGDLFVEALAVAPKFESLPVTMVGDLTGSETVDIPRKSAVSVASWTAENTNPGATSLPSFDNITMTPKEVAVLVEVSRKLAVTSNPSAQGLIVDDLGMGIARAKDKAFIVGGGTNEPTGMNTLTVAADGIAIKKIATNGGPLTWALIVGQVADLLAANVEGLPYFLVSGRTYANCMAVVKEAGEPVYLNENGKFGPNPVVYSNHIQTNLTVGTTSKNSVVYCGDFRDAIVATWGGVDILVDPLSKMPSTVRISAICDVDIAFRHGASFSKLTGVTT